MKIPLSGRSLFTVQENRSISDSGDDHTLPPDLFNPLRWDVRKSPSYPFLIVIYLFPYHLTRFHLASNDPWWNLNPWTFQFLTICDMFKNLVRFFRIYREGYRVEKEHEIGMDRDMHHTGTDQAGHTNHHMPVQPALHDGDGGPRQSGAGSHDTGGHPDHDLRGQDRCTMTAVPANLTREPCLTSTCWKISGNGLSSPRY